LYLDFYSNLFFAGLLPNGKVMNDNSSVDVISNNITYQLKFHQDKPDQNKGICIVKKIDVNKVNTKTLFECDYYIIALWVGNTINVYIIDNTNGYLNDEYEKFLTNKDFSILISGGGSISRSKLKNAAKNNANITNIEISTDILSKKIKGICDVLNNTISNFKSSVDDLQKNFYSLVRGANTGKRDNNSIKDRFKKIMILSKLILKK
jgi:hypothetical protein